jgi:endonuclease G
VSRTLARAISVMMILAFPTICLTQEQPPFGFFVGKLFVEVLKDGRLVKLTKPLTYVDPQGEKWVVPSGAVSDGASIPQVFWITHPPFTGKYREAAVIHDYYCVIQSRTWQKTHDAFYYAMRAAGVDDRTATVMWAAVYYLGPRWGVGGQTRGPGASDIDTIGEEQEFMDSLERWIASESPSRQTIERTLDAEGVPPPYRK